MSDSHPVRFAFQGAEVCLSLDEANALIGTICAARDKLKIKCPTCRCRIYPGSACSCCAGACADPEPFV